MFHELEKTLLLCMAGLTNVLYPNLSLTSLNKNRHKATIYAKYSGKVLLLRVVVH